tara:strand:- start:114524 stop:114796 length:273 start_codon:yes stop_codon:yes gene_type:complete
MKRVYYYLECDKTTKLFSYLEEQVEEGFITYKINEMQGLIIIDNLVLEDDDDLFKNLLKMDLIEDLDTNIDSFKDDDYDDFFNEDDIENN